jgi:hypothetical protein
VLIRSVLALVVCGSLLQAQELRVVSSDFAFRAPARVRPGVNRVTLVNRGRDVHHLVIARLTDSLDAQQAFQLIVENKPAPSEVHDVGGPNATAPGDSSVAWVLLEPGRYMLSCWITAPDGRLHIMKGMFAQIEVAGVPLRTPQPRATLRITAREYSLETSRSIGRGVTTIEFVNDGTQEHDLQFVRLAPGASATRVAERVEGDTAALRGAEFVGGVSGVGPGRRAWTRIMLKPGRYALFCFVPDEKDGKAHFRHGMLREFVVR